MWTATASPTRLPDHCACAVSRPPPPHDAHRHQGRDYGAGPLCLEREPRGTVIEERSYRGQVAHRVHQRHDEHAPGVDVEPYLQDAQGHGAQAPPGDPGSGPPMLHQLYDVE